MLPLSTGCADVASCHSRSISLAFTHTHSLTHSHSRSHAHFCLPLSQRSTAPNGHTLPVVSYEHLCLGPSSSSGCLNLSSSPRLPASHFVTKAVAKSVPTQILLCNTERTGKKQHIECMISTTSVLFEISGRVMAV